MKDVQIAFEQKYGIQPAMLYGKTPKQDRVDIKQNANIIFTNYKFGSTGLNIQRVKSMLFFEPHKSLGQQVNGRAMRDSSETVRLYVDIVDMGSFLSGQIRYRMEDYNARGFFVETVAIKVSDLQKN
jgi:predicted helicase